MKGADDDRMLPLAILAFTALAAGLVVGTLVHWLG
jgi:hypothetical protein